MARFEVIDKRLGHAAGGFGIKVDDCVNGPDQPIAHRKAFGFFLGRDHPEEPPIPESGESEGGEKRPDPARCRVSRRICQSGTLCLGNSTREAFRKCDFCKEDRTVQNSGLGGATAVVTMSGVPVTEPVVPGKQPVIPFGMRCPDLGIIDAAPDTVGHPKVALATFVDPGKETPGQSIRQRHEVCFGDRWVARCQDRGSLIRICRQRPSNFSLDVLRCWVGSDAHPLKCRRNVGPVLGSKFAQTLLKGIQVGRGKRRLLKLQRPFHRKQA